MLRPTVLNSSFNVNKKNQIHVFQSEVHHKRHSDFCQAEFDVLKSLLIFHLHNLLNYFGKF